MGMLVQVFTGLTTLLVCQFLMGQSCSAEKENFLVETRVIVGKSAYEGWMKRTGKTEQNDLKMEIDTLFLEVTELFKSFKVEKCMDFKFDIVDLKVDEDSDILTRHSRLLGLDHIGLNTYKESNPLPAGVNHDITVLFNGVNLVGNVVTAQSHICTNVDSSRTPNAIIDFTASWQDAYTLARLFGLIFGSAVDSGSCNDKYVMNRHNSYDSTNRFQFSQCSLDQISERLMGKGGDCLRDGDMSKAISEENTERFHKIVSPDENCKRATMDRESYVPRDTFWSYNHHMCLKLECKTKSDKDLVVMAPQGAVCGKFKTCQAGQCVRAQKEEDMKDTDSCPFGDMKEINYKNYTRCSQLPIHECGAMKYQCCQTCNLARLNQPDEICREHVGPHSSLARFAYSGAEAYEKDICSRLACTTGITDRRRGTFSFEYFEGVPDGMVCGKSKQCLNGQCFSRLADQQGPSFNSDRCPFGDQPFTGLHWKTCGDLATRNPNRCQRSNSATIRPKNVCCESCHNV